MDELTRIKAFVDTVESGGFSAAARKSDSSVSSLARQVKALEDELGVRLINRNTRSQSLSEAGQLFYDRTRELMDDLDAAKKDVQTFQKDVKGFLRVTLRVSSAGLILPALPSFLSRYPNLNLDLSLTDEQLDLVANKIDVAVWLGQLEDSTLVRRLLSPSKRIICGSPAYFADHGIPEKPSDLTKHNCLVFKAIGHRSSWKFRKGDEHVDVRVSGNLRSENGPVLLAGALSGLGIVLMQEYMVRPALVQGQLCAVLSDYNVTPTDATDEQTALYAVYPNRKGISSNTRAFVDFLVEQIRKPQPQS
jgi:DNA-binding transcriptional LysR family regulator